MHTLLENYLSEVAARLGALPAKRRADELCEMRAHLENAVIVNRELGQSEDEAAQSAVAQFGAAHDLGHEIAAAWRRGEALNRRSLSGAAICVLSVSFLVPLFLSPLETAYYNPAGRGRFEPSLWAALFFNLAGPLSAGVAGGVVFPKRAVAGTGLGRMAYFCLALALGGYWIAHDGPVMFPVSPSSVILSIAGQSVSGGIVSLLSAWIVSRWRDTRAGRARPVRG